MVRFVGRSAVKFQQYKKYDKKLYDKNNTTKNQQSAKQYKKNDKTFAYYRVVGNQFLTHHNDTKTTDNSNIFTGRQSDKYQNC